jgi:hypothetical protein
MRRLLFCLFALSAARASAGVSLSMWERYTHKPDDVVHYGFHLERSHFHFWIGSCGPQTSVIDWLYAFDLSGPGPVRSRRGRENQTALASELPTGGTGRDLARVGVIVDRPRRGQLHRTGLGEAS